MKSLHVCSVSWLLYALLERVYSSRFISQDAEYSLRARTALVSANASTMLPDKLPAGHCFKSRLGNTLLSREGSPSDGKTKENSSSARTFRQSAVLIPAFCWSNHTVTLMEQHGRLSGRYQQEGQTKGIRYHASFVHMNDILVMTIRQMETYYKLLTRITQQKYPRSKNILLVIGTSDLPWRPNSPRLESSVLWSVLVFMKAINLRCTYNTS